MSSFGAAGCTYCGVSTLSILGRLPPVGGKHQDPRPGTVARATSADVRDLLHWLTARQTSMLTDYRDFDGIDDDDSEVEAMEGESEKPEPGFKVLASAPLLPPQTFDFESLSLGPPADIAAGFNGRCNKPADTCYSFWTVGTLAVGCDVCASCYIPYCTNSDAVR